MYFPGRKANYEKRPLLRMDGYEAHACAGYEVIAEELKSKIAGSSHLTLVMDFYYGVDEEEIRKELIERLPYQNVYYAEDAKLPESEIYPKIERNLTDDRVFGSLSTHNMIDFYDKSKVEAMRAEVEAGRGLTIVYGVGASVVTKGDLLVYFDISRWEIQLRYRAGLDNWGVGNYDEDILRKYKRGYFVEWRVMDRHKVALYDDIAYLVDGNLRKSPKMIDKTLLDAALKRFTETPFRLIPYFDEGIWGGRWMEEVCGLERKKHNFAWCFDGVPEENSIGILVNGIEVEMPAMNLVKRHPRELLGPKVFSRFGAEFPIRFDFLDTMGGGNLSLQVHPLTEFIHENFGMAYTQDESYYILDAGEDACVYLGVKDGVTAEDIIPALERANTGEETFDDSRYVNCFPVKKHDHVLIPAGTIHCSGANAMVLEISATPYIFTFKLWDWGRVGLDGKPRPVNLERGAQNIQFDRNTDWCRENIVNRVETLQEEDGWKVERTGLHSLEFIETRRYWFDRKQRFTSRESVHVLNLIEGEEALITSPKGAFPPVVVHYAETFIVPEQVKEYDIEPCGLSKGKTVAVIQAAVRV